MLVLTLWTITRLTAFGQPSSNDSVLIHRDQQKQCIKWFYQTQYQDSIIHTKDSIIVHQNAFIEATEETITELDNELNKSKSKSDKYKKQRNRSILGGFGLAIITFFVGLII